MRRLGESENFIGARWIYLDLEARFDSSQPAAGARAGRPRGDELGPGPRLRARLARQLLHRRRAAGRAYLESMFYSPDIGSDDKYQTYRAHVFGYFPLEESFVLGGRLDARAGARRRAVLPAALHRPARHPGGALPGRECRRSAKSSCAGTSTPRWALLGFLGAGRAWGSSTEFGDAETVTSWGAGLRYLIARRLGIYMGLDLAKGPEETAIYIQAGSAWR